MTQYPAKTVERFCRYRQVLLEMSKNQREFVFAHEIAERLGISSTQVRRDVMSLSISGSPHKGYLIHELASELGLIIDEPDGQKIGLVGIGNLGKALLAYFIKRRPLLTIAAAFDSDPRKVNRVINGCRTYPVSEIPTVVKELEITIGVITSPEDTAQDIANMFVDSGVRGILNFAPVRLQVPPSIYLENIDITLAVEKTAYFAKVFEGPKKGGEK